MPKNGETNVKQKKPGFFQKKLSTLGLDDKRVATYDILFEISYDN